MSTFQIKKNKFVKIKEKRFNYEKDLQEFVEFNLDEVFGLTFVCGALNKQFVINNREIDTLAFDAQSNSFVIIEYKRDRSYSVIDQGYFYLALLLNNKADFILHYNEVMNKSLKKSDVDWSQSRVIFIAREFTPYQRGAIEFKDLQFELWEVQMMENNLISFNQIKTVESKESITKVTKSKQVEEVSKEVRSYTYEEHLKRGNKEIQLLLEKLKEKILLIDENIKEKPVGNYLGYKLNWYNFASVHVYKKKLKVFVRKNKLVKDANKKFKKVPASYEWGKTSLWWIDIEKETEINYVMNVIKESYESAPDR